MTSEAATVTRLSNSTVAYHELMKIETVIAAGAETLVHWKPQRLFRLHWILFFGAGLERLVVESIWVGNFEQLREPWKLTRPMELQDRCFSVVEPEQLITMRVKNVGDQDHALCVQAIGITILEPDEMPQEQPSCGG